MRALALQNIAEVLAEEGKLDLALQVAQKIEDAYDRSWTLSTIADALIEAGLFDRALQFAEKIEDTFFALFNTLGHCTGISEGRAN
jgi:serine protease Do